jgi:hypothetical protein
MLDGHLILTLLWYLLGDVLRIVNEDIELGTLADISVTPVMWLVIAVLLVISIVMMTVSLMLTQQRHSPG